MKPEHSSPPAAEMRGQSGQTTDAPLCVEPADHFDSMGWHSTTALFRLRRIFRHIPFLGMMAGASVSIFVHQSLAATNDQSSSAAGTVQQRWTQETVQVVLDESLLALGSDTQQIIEEAFLTWERTGAHLPEINFSWGQGSQPSLEADGKSTILVSPIAFEGHESDLAITIGFSNPNTGEISEADIVINSKHLFSRVTDEQANLGSELASAPFLAAENESCSGSIDARACGETYDLENVLTHEVGHFLGLGEDYDDTRTTMFSCTSSCEIHKRTLEPSDTESIVELYKNLPDDRENQSGCDPLQIGKSRAFGRSGSKSSELWGSFSLILSMLWWRRRPPPKTQKLIMSQRIAPEASKVQQHHF